jgi:threonyl-tRNA synthetase
MIKVTFPDGSVREYEVGVSALQVAEAIGSRLAQAAVGAIVDEQPYDLSRPLPGDCALKILTFKDAEGREVYRHSSTHLMAQAVKELYPEAKLTVGPPLADRFYYDIDMPPVGEEEFAKIEAKMMELAKADLPIVREEVSRAEARALFEGIGETYKLEIIDELPEDATITLYRQGNWVDLCRGPHLPSTGRIKAVKILSASGAFWRGDAQNKQLQRLYGTSYPSQKELDAHMERLEQAKARDHRKLGRELGLFLITSEVGAGLPLWLPKGATLRRILEDFIRGELVKRGYQPVYTPNIARASLFEQSGHMTAYAESMYPVMERDGEEFVLKPVNCPFHVQIYKSEKRSYRDLPLRYAEFGTVYRWEQSGEVGGLTRVRGFTQDDAHLFLAPEQLPQEFKNNVELILLILNRLGLTYSARVGLRDPAKPDKYVGSEEAWEQSQSALLAAVRELGLEHTVEEGEAAIYGPKLDFIVNDAIGRQWQLGTVQVDYVLPERFGLEYTGSDGQAHRPVMIHRAPFGSLERFCGVLIEHFAGAFPLWLAPVQVAVLPIADRHHEYAKQLASELEAAGFRVELNSANEKVGAKIAIAESHKVPYMAVIGDREAESGGVSLRARGRQDLGAMSKEEMFTKLRDEAAA